MARPARPIAQADNFSRDVTCQLDRFRQGSYLTRTIGEDNYVFHIVSILLDCQFFYFWSSHMGGGWSVTEVPVNQVSLSQTVSVNFYLFVEFEMSNSDSGNYQICLSCKNQGGAVKE